MNDIIMVFVLILLVVWSFLVGYTAGYTCGYDEGEIDQLQYDIDEQRRRIKSRRKEDEQK